MRQHRHGQARFRIWAACDVAVDGIKACDADPSSIIAGHPCFFGLPNVHRHMLEAAKGPRSGDDTQTHDKVLPHLSQAGLVCAALTHIGLPKARLRVSSGPETGKRPQLEAVGSKLVTRDYDGEARWRTVSWTGRVANHTRAHAGGRPCELLKLGVWVRSSAAGRVECRSGCRGAVPT